MRNVLLLGADPATVCLYRTHFEQLGLTLASAEMVEPLEDFIRLAQPDAVLLDVTQPNLDADTLVRNIRAQPDFQHLPLFALTNRQPATGGVVLTAATKSFQKLPTLAPVIVRTIAQALTAPAQAAPATNSPSNNPAKGAPSPLPAAVREELAASRPSLSVLPSEVPSLVQQLSERRRAYLDGSEDQQIDNLSKMQEQVRDLRRALLTAESAVLAGFTSALARLLITLSKDLGKANPSSLRTLSSALDALQSAVASAGLFRKIEKGPVRVLIVDDDAISRRALQFALSSPDLVLEARDSIEGALESSRDSEFDVVFTDVRMLGRADLSAALQGLPERGDVPLVVVTPLPDFDARVKSALNGTSDVIAKPFTPSEMVLKAFTLALKRRLGPTTATPAESPTTPLPEPATSNRCALPEASRLSEAGSSRLPTVEAPVPPGLEQPIRPVLPAAVFRAGTSEGASVPSQEASRLQPAVNSRARSITPTESSRDLDRQISELHTQLRAVQAENAALRSELEALRAAHGTGRDQGVPGVGEPSGDALNLAATRAAVAHESATLQRTRAELQAAVDLILEQLHAAKEALVEPAASADGVVNSAGASHG